ncbi:ADP-ribosyltransferase [Nocardia jinanensis]|uniref:ADP ribosyltransferase domain-containing protein n=1 Tax=Nocardia jinanensis TaxID=382504 RepID=A0A917VYC9_9NOCA|nr:ADP-ribosyltransferase [Nocardia jinanensis]GGL36660.1 hypothetical protein GCM10011588_59250 [Nocardia jinanensis]
MKYLTEQLQQTLDTVAAGGAANLRTVARESPAGANTVAAAADGSKLGFHPEILGSPRLPAGSGGRSIPPNSPLTPREIMALETYTGTGSPEVNRALREGRGIDFQHDVDDLRSALRKLDDFRGTVYRHIDLPEEVLAQHRKGAVITELGFMSTSTRPYALKKGHVHIAMASFTGKSVKQWSADPDEEEILFLDGTSYRVHSRVDRLEQGRLHSYMSAFQTEMPPRIV